MHRGISEYEFIQALNKKQTKREEVYSSKEGLRSEG